MSLPCKESLAMLNIKLQAWLLHGTVACCNNSFCATVPYVHHCVEPIAKSSCSFPDDISVCLLDLDADMPTGALDLL